MRTVRAGAGLARFFLGLSPVLTALLAWSSPGRAQQPASDALDLLQPPGTVIPLRTIDPHDEDFSDLLPLREAIGGARVVALGEQSHGDGATFAMKDRLIRFLHQEMGFDVVVWESGLVDCRFMDASLRAGAPVEEAAAEGLFPIFGRSGLVRSVLEYAQQTQRSTRPVEMAGMDCQFSSPMGADRFLDGVREFFGRVDPGMVDPAGGAEGPMPALERLARSGEWRAVGETYEADVRAVQDLVGLIDARRPEFAKVHGDRETGFMRRCLLNVLALGEASVLRLQRPGARDPALTNPRDRAMGETLAYLVDEYYAGRKVVVWAASFHLMRSAPQIDTGVIGFSYRETVPAGAVAHERLGDEYYSVMFIAGGGEAGNPFTQPRRLPPPPEGSLERALSASASAASYIDLRGLPGTHPLRSPVTAGPLGYGPMLAPWPEVFDAVIFTPRMFPSTADGVLPEWARTAPVRDAAGAPGAPLLETLRQAAAVWRLDQRGVMPGQFHGRDESRLARYPGPRDWPDLLGPVPPDILSFRTAAADGTDFHRAGGAVRVSEPFTGVVVGRDRERTILLLEGVRPGAALTLHAGSTLACRGEMAGTIVLDGYSTLLVDGPLSGGVEIDSYVNVVVTGPFSGRIDSRSYSTLLLLGGLDGGRIEASSTTRVYIGGRVTRDQIAAAVESRFVTMYVEESDLPPGEHRVGEVDVVVGPMEQLRRSGS